MPMPSFEQERLRTHWTASTQRAALLRQEEFLTFARPQKRDLSASEMPMGLSKSVCWISPSTSTSMSYIIWRSPIALPISHSLQKNFAAGWRTVQRESCTMPGRVGGIDSLASRGERWNGSTLLPNFENNVTGLTTLQVDLWRRCWLGTTRFYP